MTKKNANHIKKSLIQIVDDVPANIQVLGKILAGRGYNVAVSGNGKDALAALTQIQPDLILLDVMMPGMDGIEVCRRIKSKKKSADIPVLFISAQSEMDYKLRGFKAGGADYISKPFDAVEVLARVETHLKLKHAMDTIQEYNKELEKLVKARTRELVQAERRAAFSLFSKGIVHNLRGPLTAIYGGIQLLQIKKEKIDTMQIDGMPDEMVHYLKLVTKYVGIINLSAQKLNDMIESLMTKFKTDNSVIIEKIELNQLLMQEISFLTANPRFKHNINKIIDLSSEQLYAKVIPGDINQIVENIVLNALDAMYESNAPEINFASGKDGDIVWFSISDNGPGMSLEVQEKIFDAFYSTKPMANESGDNTGPVGTGLGLFMCKQIVGKYKGKLELYSAPGKGAEFKISLPVAR